MRRHNGWLGYFMCARDWCSATSCIWGLSQVICSLRIDRCKGLMYICLICVPSLRVWTNRSRNAALVYFVHYLPLRVGT